jgi:hypothetical protein
VLADIRTGSKGIKWYCEEEPIRQTKVWAQKPEKVGAENVYSLNQTSCCFRHRIRYRLHGWKQAYPVKKSNKTMWRITRALLSLPRTFWTSDLLISSWVWFVLSFQEIVLSILFREGKFSEVEWTKNAGLPIGVIRQSQKIQKRI